MKKVLITGIKMCIRDRDENGNIKTYGYGLRNKSTSNVHMILYTALMKMMDRTECLMFVKDVYKRQKYNTLIVLIHQNNQSPKDTIWILLYFPLLNRINI